MSRLAKTLSLSLFLVVFTLVFGMIAVSANNDTGRTSIDLMADQYLLQYPEARWLRDFDIRDANNNPIPGHVNPALVPGAGPLGTLYPPTPAAAMGFDTESKLYEGMYYAGLKQLGGFNGQVNSDLKSYSQELQAGDFMARTLQYPPNVANQAKAQAIGQAQAMSNAMGDIAKSQSASAISYCSSFLQNFTVDEGNRWNKIRNGLFVPIALLLLLPGAILTQVRAMALAGNPVLMDPLNPQPDMNPLEGLLRSVVAIFLIPATYLVVNYGIDFSNSIVDSIAGTYQSVMGTNMYQDALGNEVRAFPVRSPRENQNAGSPRAWPATPIKSIKDFENNYIIDKVEDPSLGFYNVPANKSDEAMPSAAVAARQLSYGANAALTAAWNILCAFQMAYLSYLFFVGPIAAALWVWPMANFKNALPNWIEGVITLCFWSLFWNTAILLMACFNGVDESSTMITSALNFLATSSVKFAFDFAGLVRAAGQEAATKATANAGGGAGKAGSAGSAGRAGSPGVNRDTALNGQVARDQITNSANNALGTAPDSVDSASPLMQGNAVVASALASTNANFLLPGIALPPLALSSNNGSNYIHSQSVSLGNYAISRGFDSQGNPQDLLKTSSGVVIAELPPDLANGADYTTNGVKVVRNNNEAGSSYSLTDTLGRTYAASISSTDSLSSGAIVGGALSNDKSANGTSIALRSTAGTLLLEGDGNTILIPGTNGGGYDAYSLKPDANADSFALPDGRSLAISRNSDGSQLVALGSPNGSVESFKVMSNTSGGFDIAHQMNGVSAGSSIVSTDGSSTTYNNYDANGKLTDVDKISGNNIASALYDPANGAVLGFVDSTYTDNGSSETKYYQANGSLTASTDHLYKLNGGYVNTVRDNLGQAVSVQDVTPALNGGYTLQSTRLQDGQAVSALTSNYDANFQLIPGDTGAPLTRAATLTSFARYASNILTGDDSSASAMLLKPEQKSDFVETQIVADTDHSSNRALLRNTIDPQHIQAKSLQKQAIDNDLPRTRTIADILRTTSTKADASKAAGKADVNYNRLNSTLQQGQTYQAQQFVPIVEQDLHTMENRGDSKALISSYIELLKRHEMFEQADSFQTLLDSGKPA